MYKVCIKCVAAHSSNVDCDSHSKIPVGRKGQESITAVGKKRWEKRSRMGREGDNCKIRLVVSLHPGREKSPCLKN